MKCLLKASIVQFKISAFLLFIVFCLNSVSHAEEENLIRITRGRSFLPVDFLGNVLALPGKLILWNWKFSNHSISEKTEEKLESYLLYRSKPAFDETVFRLNEYSPLADVKALWRNKHMGWPYRLILGTVTTLIYDVLLPGRLFPWGDYYNPFTNTAHIYSDDFAIVLHEAGHAYDFANYPYKGLYALIRIVPFTNLYQEWCATDEALRYLKETNLQSEEIRAYKVLYPAYGTYAGSYLPVPFGSAIGAIGGHIVGRLEASQKKKYYYEMETILNSPGLGKNSLEKAAKIESAKSFEKLE